MLCRLDNHDDQRLKYICTDQQCQSEAKIGCADCFLENHELHKRQGIEKFQEDNKKVLDKLQNMKELHLDELQIKDDELDQLFSIKQLNEVREQQKQSLCNILSAQLVDVNKNDKSNCRINELYKLINKEEQLSLEEYEYIVEQYYNDEMWDQFKEEQKQKKQKIEMVRKKKDKYFAKLNSICEILFETLMQDMTEEDISERESTARKNDEDSPIISSTQKKRVKFNDEW